MIDPAPDGVSDDALRLMAERLVEVEGVVGVLLGGSRARGDHTAESDADLGVYYRHPLDVRALGDMARAMSGPDAQVTSPGAWGPWVDGGAWLHVDGHALDWIYRDVERVHTSWSDARAGGVRIPLAGRASARGAGLRLCRRGRARCRADRSVR